MINASLEVFAPTDTVNWLIAPDPVIATVVPSIDVSLGPVLTFWPCSSVIFLPAPAFA